MKTKYLLLIYNKSIGYIDFKFYVTSKNLYCMYFNRAWKSLFYRNHSKPKSLSVISILLLAVWDA